MSVYTARNTKHRELSGDAISTRAFEQLRDFIRAESGISLGSAKRDLLCSRLARRIRHLGLRGYDEYYHHLLTVDRDGTELQQMVNCVTTTKTDFFRESHHFDFLRNHAIRQWRANAAATSNFKLRIWSTACSRGHEPYSVAITLMDHFGPRVGWDIKILGTDINTDVLEIAERGIYPIEEIADLPREVRDRHFMKGTGRWVRTVRVRDELRRMVAFRRLNIAASDWPFQGAFNAIFCRNVMIYFDEPQQRQLVAKLSERLESGGNLFLGHSENQSWLTNYVEPLGQTIYCKRGPLSTND
ncbi:MAG: protein-glutamate O-methyltransferase CheR [Planctomycetes bacterium]|nr:protein-glutamate O-methyltransferase CheR [Planctomycetota bacterium]